MATEHVIPTSVHARQSHAEATPNGKRPMQFLPHTSIHLSSTLQVLSWHGEGGHKHGKAAKQEYSAHQTTEPSQKDWPVLVKEEDQDPDVAQDHATHFSHGEGPRDPRNTV